MANVAPVKNVPYIGMFYVYYFKREMIHKSHCPCRRSKDLHQKSTHSLKLDGCSMLDYIECYIIDSPVRKVYISENRL